MTEAEIQRQCIELFTRTGWLVIRLNGGRSGTILWSRWYDSEGVCHQKGISDILAVKDSRLLALEVKRPGGKLSVEQKAFLTCAMEHGATPLVVEDVKELESYL
jgi:Holliday junction resolvase